MEVKKSAPGLETQIVEEPHEQSKGTNKISISPSFNEERLRKSHADQEIRHRAENSLEREASGSNVIPDTLYNLCPTLIREPCKKLVGRNEKEVCLIGLIVVCSAVTHGVVGVYNGRKVWSNLFAWVLGIYGGGKGVLSLIKKVGNKIHDRKKAETARNIDVHKQQTLEYQKKLKDYQNDSDGNVSVPESVQPPKHQKFFIPANISKTGMLQLLHENDGRGLIYETEADTLADAQKQDYGAYSDAMRAFFQHEDLTFFRRTNNEDVEIRSPRVSIVLSSTFDQLLKLVPTAENGLFSRFLYYELEYNAAFENVFDKSKVGYDEYFESLGETLERLYLILELRQTETLFDLTDSQKEAFVAHFNEVKGEIVEYVSEDLGGTVNRLGLIAFRIAMVLSTLRAFERTNYRDLPEVVTCTDQDFEIAMQLSGIFLQKAIAVYKRLPKRTAYTPPINTSESDVVSKSEIELQQIKRAIELSKQGMSCRKISRELFGSEGSRNKIIKWLYGDKKKK